MATFWKNINNAFLEGVSTAEPHGTPKSGAPEKYPKLLGIRPKRPEARGRRVATFWGTWEDEYESENSGYLPPGRPAAPGFR